MSTPVTVALIDDLRARLRDLTQAFAPTLPHHHYTDVRVAVSESKHAVAEDGTPKGAGQDYDIALGVRVLAGRDTIAPGYAGREIGAGEVGEIERIVRGLISQAHARAVANAAQKQQARSEFPALGESLQPTTLAPIPVHQATVPAQFAVDFDAVPLPEVITATLESSRAVQASDSRLVYNAVWAVTARERSLFLSSEGAEIDQSFAITQGMAYLVGQSADANVELYDYIGHQRGWETLRDGLREPLIHNPPLLDFALALARDVCDLVEAPPLPSTDHEVTVVTDPHFNALVAHEIVGHPCEADRALKMETGYAGRSWFLRSLSETQVGKRVGSDLLTAYSDPTLPGYGHYAYDDEGTPAKQAVHIENGIFRSFLHSRQTAAILGAKPNGSYKAAQASLAPLIRMSNTVFAPGRDDPADLIKEVEHGYYLVGHRTPSIAESRENFRITAMKVYEIRNGEIGQLYRDGGIQSDSLDYFLNIDGVGTDFRLFPIPNCGKGQPMQTKQLGNGGPTMRSRARLTGV